MSSESRKCLSPALPQTEAQRGTQGTDTLLIHQNTVSFSFKDDSKDLSTWERGAPAPQCLSELLERQSGAGAPRSRERRTSFLQDLV